MRFADVRPCLVMLSLLVGASVATACGDDSDVGQVAPSTPSSTARPVPRQTPTLGELSVTDGCAQVNLPDGTTWSESCLEPDIGVVAVTSQTIDGVELALLRFMPVVELVSADPTSVTFEQSEGWALVESPTPDFTMTFRQEGVEEKAVCTYNPFFIDCDTSAVG